MLSLLGALLVLVNLAAHVVLLPVHLLAFLRRQFSAVGLAIIMDFAIQIGFAILKVRGLTRSETAVGNAVCDPALLIESAAINRVHRNVTRAAVIHGGKLAAVLGGHALVSKLIGRGLEVLFAHGHLLLGSGTSRDPARTVVTDPIDNGGVVDDRAVDVDVADDGGVYVRDRGVVVEGAADPGAADEAYADIAEAVINAAIVSNMRTPIAGMPHVNAATPTPVTGRP
jgi:hypothetical protein